MLKAIKTLSLVLVLVGAFNWGLVGIFEFDLVAKIFGEMTLITRAVYSLVGISSLIVALTIFTPSKTD